MISRVYLNVDLAPDTTIAIGFVVGEIDDDCKALRVTQPSRGGFDGLQLTQ